MTRSCVTLVPTFDLAEFAQAEDSENLPTYRTVVPTFNVEQYARAVASTTGASPSREDPAEGCAPTLPPPSTVASAPAFTGQSAENAVGQATSRSSTSRSASPTSAPPSSACPVPHLDMFDVLLEERLVRSRLGNASAAALSHRAAFVLLHVDGISTVREIVDRCGIPREEALGTLAVLLHRGLVCSHDAPKLRSTAPSSSRIHERRPCALECEPPRSEVTPSRSTR